MSGYKKNIKVGRVMIAQTGNGTFHLFVERGINSPFDSLKEAVLAAQTEPASRNDASLIREKCEDLNWDETAIFKHFCPTQVEINATGDERWRPILKDNLAKGNNVKLNGFDFPFHVEFCNSVATDFGFQFSFNPKTNVAEFQLL